MNKAKSENDDELRPEYDLRKLLKGAIRGKYYQAMQSGYTITIHKQDGTTRKRRRARGEGNKSPSF